MSRKLLTPIELPANPTQPLEAATKQYVDSGAGGGISQAAADARYVNLDGDTMTAPLVVPGPPASTGHAANKAYVDSLAYTDTQRCYFLMLLTNTYNLPADGFVRVPFDTEQTDPALIATIGSTANFNPPRNGRMQINWSVSCVITSGSGTPNMTSVIGLHSNLTEQRRGSQLVVSMGAGGQFASTGSVALNVTAGQALCLVGYIQASGQGKQFFGGNLTWLEGYYLTS